MIILGIIPVGKTFIVTHNSGGHTSATDGISLLIALNIIFAIMAIGSYIYECIANRKFVKIMLFDNNMFLFSFIGFIIITFFEVTIALGIYIKQLIS